jgi:hypothetical protein
MATGHLVSKGLRREKLSLYEEQAGCPINKYCIRKKLNGFFEKNYRMQTGAVG